MKIETLALASSIALATGARGEPSWIGQNLNTIKDSPFINRFNYSDCPDTASLRNLPNDTTRLDCLFPEKDQAQGEEVHLLPNPPVIQELFTAFPNTSKVNPNYSFSSIVFSVDDRFYITNGSFYIHPEAEKAAIENGGSRTQRADRVLQPFLKEATGHNVSSTKAIEIYNRTMNCGAHADGDGSGAGYTTEIGNVNIVIGGGSTERQADPSTSVLEVLSGNCAVTFSEAPNSSPEPNPAPESSSASPSLKPSYMTWGLTLASSLIALSRSPLSR